MKRLLASLSVFVSINAFSQSALEVSGFKVIEDNSVVQTLIFQDLFEFKISKDRFLTQKSAIQFCKAQRSKLDTEFNSLLIAMSGATKVSKFLRSAIRFKFKHDSGIWQWSKERDMVTLMLNGGGVVTQNISVSDLNKIMRLSLPAICIKNL